MEACSNHGAVLNCSPLKKKASSQILSACESVRNPRSNDCGRRYLPLRISQVRDVIKRLEAMKHFISHFHTYLLPSMCTPLSQQRFMRVFHCSKRCAGSLLSGRVPLLQ
ncbi:hypothetical protein TNCV_3355381 [Trichonephila clavipes]|nr:hypothetical protein TNCV_3355381 [Trichonephila clavipes]